MKLSRRSFLGGSAVALVSAAAISGRSKAATIPEAPTTDSPSHAAAGARRPQDRTTSRW